MAYKIRWTVQQRDRFVRRWLKFRERYGLTQEQLAEAMGIHVNTVNRVERAKFVPNDNTVLRFVEVEKKYKRGDDIKRHLACVPGGTPEI